MLLKLVLMQSKRRRMLNQSLLDTTLAALERGYEIRESELMSIGLHPILTRELGDEPRYRRLLERMNLR